MKIFINENWLKILAIILLAGALLTFPYAYYQLMEWTVMGAGLMTAWQAYKMKINIVMWLFLLIAVVFNPLAPFYLSDVSWRVLDVTTAGLFLLSFLVLRAKKNKTSKK